MVKSRWTVSGAKVGLLRLEHDLSSCWLNSMSPFSETSLVYKICTPYFIKDKYSTTPAQHVPLIYKERISKESEAS